MNIIKILICLFSACNALPFEMQNSVLSDKFRIKSWKNIRDSGIVKQSFDYSCGASSVATLLNNLYRENLSEKEILKAMNINLMASFDDMQKILPEFGFVAKGYILKFDELMKIKIPVIVYLKYRKSEHFSVLRGIDNDTILLADPSGGHISMSKKEFLAAWNTSENFGKILAILPQKDSATRNNLFFITKPKRQTDFTMKNIKNWQKF